MNGTEDIAAIIRDHGIRPTANRITVAKALAAKTRAVTLAELEADLETIDRSNIFRTLALFRERHLIHSIDDGCDGTRYEFCHSGDTGHDSDLHVHFHCERCHRTYCLEEIPVPQVNLPEGYETESVNYMIKGLCPECSRKVY